MLRVNKWFQKVLCGMLTVTIISQYSPQTIVLAKENIIETQQDQLYLKAYNATEKCKKERTQKSVNEARIEIEKLTDKYLKEKWEFTKQVNIVQYQFLVKAAAALDLAVKNNNKGYIEKARNSINKDMPLLWSQVFSLSLDSLEFKTANVDKANISNQGNILNRKIEEVKNDYVLYKNAYNATTKALKEQTQLSVNEARKEIAKLKGAYTKEKNSFSKEIDSVQYKILMQIATKLDKAIKTKLQVDIDEARKQIPSDMPSIWINGFKLSINRVQEMKKSEASGLVEKAKATKALEDVNNALRLLEEMAASTDTQISEWAKSLIKIVSEIVIVDEPTDDPYKKAYNATERCIRERTQSSVNKARAAIDELPAEYLKEKWDLTKKVHIVQYEILFKTTEIVDKAVKSENEQDMEDAKLAIIDELPDSWKALYNNHLQSIEVNKPSSLQEPIRQVEGEVSSDKQLYLNAYHATVKSLKERTQVSVNEAREAISKVTSKYAKEKGLFTQDVDYVQYMIFTKIIADVDNVLKDGSQLNINKLRASIDTNTPNMWKDLFCSTLNQAQQDMISKATLLVEKANETKLEQDIEAARTLLNEIATSTDKEVVEWARKMISSLPVFVDEVIIFEDKNFEGLVRKWIDKPSGDIHASDVKWIHNFSDHVDKDCHISSLKGIEYFTNLYSLDLANSGNISDLEPLANLKKLTYLTFGHHKIKTLDPLKNLTNLQSLYFNVVTEYELDNKFDRGTITDISGLSNLVNLTRLDLGGNQITDISALSNLSNLIHLGLGGNEIEDITPLTNLPKLESISLYNNKIKSIPKLSSSNISYLYLDNNKINDISGLADLYKLETLYISNNEIEDISPLANLTNLTDLGLYNNKITNVKPLSSLVNLKYLSIVENPISNSDVEELRKKLPNTRIIF